LFKGRNVGNVSRMFSITREDIGTDKLGRITNVEEIRHVDDVVR